MKLPSLLVAFAISSVTSVFALTEADLQPTALVGKTLTFTVETGAAPFATTGSFSGSFGAAPSNVFTKTKITGDATTNVGTWSFNSSFSGMYEYTIVHFLPGRPDGVLTLWISEGEGRYEVFLTGLFGNSQTGAFTIDSAVPKPAEIDVKQGKTALKDGKGKVDFSTVLVTKKGKSLTRSFTLTNSGEAPLKNLGFSVDGKHRKEFQVSAPKISTIAPGASATIRVTFTPKAIGARKAELHIKSNDSDESPFDIRLSGNGGGKK